MSKSAIAVAEGAVGGPEPGKTPNSAGTFAMLAHYATACAGAPSASTSAAYRPPGQRTGHHHSLLEPDWDSEMVASAVALVGVADWATFTTAVEGVVSAAYVAIAGDYLPRADCRS